MMRLCYIAPILPEITHLSQGPHEWLIVLHTASSVNQHNIKAIFAREIYGMAGNLCSILSISLKE